MWFIEGIVNIFWEHVAKNDLSNFHFYEKIKMFKKAHLWLSPLLPLAHLIMITPLGCFHEWLPMNRNYQK